VTAAIIVGELALRLRFDVGRPNRLTPTAVALVTRNDVPMQVRHHVAERLDVHVVGLADRDDRSYDAVQIRGVGVPFRRRKLIDARCMARIEYDDAVAAVHLVERQVPRRHRQLADELPVRRDVGTWDVERAASPRGQVVPSRLRHHVAPSLFSVAM
jgi:hypothetical protein